MSGKGAPRTVPPLARAASNWLLERIDRKDVYQWSATERHLADELLKMPMVQAEMKRKRFMRPRFGRSA